MSLNDFIGIIIFLIFYINIFIKLPIYPYEIIKSLNNKIPKT